MNIFLCDFCWKCFFPDLLWGLVIIITVLGALLIISPLIKSYIESKKTVLEEKHKHEEKMKTDAFEREKEWYFIKKIEEPLEIELEDCKKKLEELQKREEELNNGTEALKKEKENFEKEVLKTKIKVYEEIIKKYK